ncbi:MAG: glycosyltransferase family 1 protein, partial [Spartobacteria bacterium]|nr:glycosyltransferase family 1 protein [Spartobacteria bacterium]
FKHREVMDRVMRRPELAGAPNMQPRLLPYDVFTPMNQLRMPGVIRDLRLDVFHSTNYMAPFPAFPRHKKGRTGCVITIHDLIPLLFPQHTPKALKTRFFFVFKRVILEAGKRADIILAPSQASRMDIIKHLAIPPERHDNVVVIPEGVARRYAPAPRRERAGRQVLYVGRLDPYKNVVTLLEAFAQVLQRVPDALLRIIGPEDPRYPEARVRSRELNLESAIDWDGYADDNTLLDAYQQADVLALPSLYEGFGLPVLEAMACGTPVVCSNVSSLPDVGGAAALQIDPRDTQALADALVAILTDPDLATDLSEKSLQRARQFTWEKTAQLTLEAYRRLQPTSA